MSVELIRDENGLFLTDGDMVVRGDFSTMIPRLKQSNLERELLVKAARIKGKDHPLVFDATAGMGEDSLLLAAAGFSVIMYEYDCTIAALLKDAIERAASIPQLSQAVERMEAIEGDSIKAMRELDGRADVIYLDPMFPERKKSAAVKKKFQLIHQLERPCENEDQLLQAAIDAAPKKIVIKRPLKADYLAGRKPSYSLTGKAIRYDVIN